MTVQIPTFQILIKIFRRSYLKIEFEIETNKNLSS